MIEVAGDEISEKENGVVVENLIIKLTWFGDYKIGFWLTSGIGEQTDDFETIGVRAEK